MKHGNIKHGMCHTRIYRIWCGMIQRCHNFKNKDYKHYGARGIKVCDRWRDPKNFIEDMLLTYKDNLQIDRIDVNGNCEPSNCQWSTLTENMNNKRKWKLVKYFDSEEELRAYQLNSFNLSYGN